jgi:hypothetical protein
MFNRRTYTDPIPLLPDFSAVSWPMVSLDLMGNMVSRVGGESMSDCVSHMDADAMSTKRFRWLFLIEGIITFGCGLLGPLLIVGYPKDKHGWLSHDEQRYLVLRQRYSANGQQTARSEGNSPALIKEVAKRWHIYPQMVIYFSHSLLGYSSTFTLPVIIRALKFTKIESYLIPVPIYFGACAWTILNCHISDKRKRRAEHVAGPFMLVALGLIFTIGARARPSLIGLTMTGLV